MPDSSHVRLLRIVRELPKVPPAFRRAGNEEALQAPPANGFEARLTQQLNLMA
jgi:hypothetical protein